MQAEHGNANRHEASVNGAAGVRQEHWNLPTAALVEQAIVRGEGILAGGGSLAVTTAPYTGRSPNDKFIVRESSCEDVIWWGKVNVAMAAEAFDILHGKVLTYLQDRDVFVQDSYTCADSNYRMRVRVISEAATAALFATNMFIRPAPAELNDFQPDFTVLHAPHFRADPAVDQTRSEAFVVINFCKGLVLVGGTGYAGEIKKSIFTVLNYLMTKRNVLPMHCSANVGDSGETALFFGLSGTGKTTLSADPQRHLIGDDEHGWSEEGVFNFEGGCYAKLINLSERGEPEIFATTRMFGTLLENVIVDPVTRQLDLFSDRITENTRGSYPISYIGNSIPNGCGTHPQNVFFLAADAFGVLPPISVLTPEQSMYHFLSGYTAKLAGTERGVVEPQATFSACFGLPFMPLHPYTYARMLGERVERHKATVWLVNTGWTGGPYGVGKRFSLEHTRALLHAALDGRLEGVPRMKDPIFGLWVPQSCPGIPSDLLQPRKTWPDAGAFDLQARKLAKMFADNFRQYAAEVAPEVVGAGPQIG